MEVFVFNALVTDADDDLECSDAERESSGLIGVGAEAPRSTASSPWRMPIRLSLCGSALLLTAFGLAAVVARRKPSGRPAEAAVDASQRLFSNLVAYEAAQKSLQMMGSAGSVTESLADFVEKTNFTEVARTLQAIRNRTARILRLKGHDLQRNNDMRDGNPCPDDEEVFSNLCYQKCSVLTQGKYPIRTTAFSCCEREPCSFFNSKFTSPLKVCQGLDVGGHDKYGCPHAPGDCLMNEEFHLGFCYKQCAVLTDSEYPYRSSADSCCKRNTYLDCLEVGNYMTNSSFSVGGGQGDDIFEDLGVVHPPMPGFAEEQTTTPPLILATLPPPPALPTPPPPPILATLPPPPALPTLPPPLTFPPM